MRVSIIVILAIPMMISCFSMIPKKGDWYWLVLLLLHHLLLLLLDWWDVLIRNLLKCHLDVLECISNICSRIFHSIRFSCTYLNLWFLLYPWHKCSPYILDITMHALLVFSLYLSCSLINNLVILIQLRGHQQRLEYHPKEEYLCRCITALQEQFSLFILHLDSLHVLRFSTYHLEVAVECQVGDSRSGYNLSIWLLHNFCQREYLTKLSLTLSTGSSWQILFRHSARSSLYSSHLSSSHLTDYKAVSSYHCLHFFDKKKYQQ